MADPVPLIYLVRHGETPWSLSGQHTGRTDLAMTEKGERAAQAVAGRLKGITFGKVFSSPLQRAFKTCELAGFGDVAERDPDLLEWDYGKYEGVLTRDIHKEQPDWNLFKHGAPGGEDAAAVGVRADRAIARIRAVGQNVAVFSSAHFLRVFGARWLGLPPSSGSLLMLDTASLSILTYEHHNLDEPVIRVWNDTNHVPKE